MKVWSSFGLKACFQVSLGCGPVAGSGEKKSKFDALGCYDRASDRMQWCRSA